LLHTKIEEIKKIFKYCKELPFEKTPDYNFLYESIESVFRRLNLEYDFKYDWLNTDEHINRIKPFDFLGPNHIKTKRKKTSEKMILSETYKHRNTNMNENLLPLRKKSMELYFYPIITRNAVEKEEREEGFLETWCCFI